MLPPVICPTVTAADPHEYRSQVELLEPFAKRLHIDFMDGQFTSNRSIKLNQAWWPDELVADLHLMYQQPADWLDQVIKLKPSLVIIHFEAEVNHLDFAKQLQANGIKAGLAVLQPTTVAEVASVMDAFDHLMIFSGKLGYHGGTFDPALLDKVRQARERWPQIEIAWDGGVNDQNAKQLIEAGADVLNVGSFIHKAADPQAAYAKLESVLKD